MPWNIKLLAFYLNFLFRYLDTASESQQRLLGVEATTAVEAED